MLRRPPEQGRGSIRDHLTHRERDIRSLDSRGRKDLTRDAIEIRRIARDDADDEIVISRDAVHLDDLGDLGERDLDFSESVLVDPCCDEGRQGVAESGGMHPMIHRRERLARLEPHEPRLHGVAGEAETLGYLHAREPGVVTQSEKDAGIGGVESGHVTQYRTPLGARTMHIAQQKYD